MGNALGGSWRGVLVAAGVAALLFAVIIGLAVTGRLGDLKYWSFPSHPYPPTGYYINPFNSGDKGDLVNSAEASRVRSDLLEDGTTELRALESGNVDLLMQSDTSRSFEKEKQEVLANTAQGLRERFSNAIESTSVGFLADPNDPTGIRWFVNERGTSTVTMIRAGDGSVVSQQHFRFDGKFWLLRVNGRYLIADAQVTTQP
jgi:hypothetical protein